MAKKLTVLDLVDACKNVQEVSDESVAIASRRFLKITFANITRKLFSMSCDADFFRKGKFFNQPGDELEIFIIFYQDKKFDKNFNKRNKITIQIFI